MQPVTPMETGVMFWAGRDSLAELKSMGVRCGQLGIAGDVELTDEFAAQWKADLGAHGFALITVFAAYDGESYADIPTVEKTVGFIPRATRDARVARTKEISDFAAKIGAPGIACHIGFVPHDPANEDYIAVREAVRDVCDHAARYGQTFALETGQEPAATLLHFFQDVQRANLRINFDPANMILYGTGDPIEALKLLAPHVVSVHAKDGDWPPKDTPGALGTERPLGQGSVGIPRFVAMLREIGFQSSLNIERETEPQEVRIADIRMAVGLLDGLKR